MNRIVREHYPVADLPETLQAGLEQGDHVRVILERERPASERSIEEKRALLEELFKKAKPSFNGLEDIERHVGSLRKEWD